ncbi:AraC family transcriptional regulator [Pseudomonas sp. KNUC1026]|uniref:AraC family transcriptional regulator n=1 Tax=Pseudomonas sp. KNUC1026 TaxID=2893890 RepID=UPI001F1CDC82|nr:AraC family transcriptional regulator N-terminal domain-containing protein [Pseudomonas sp. KNUC1026]UFH50489.1 AraC family transcriptional regulator N-terminal domain-containing protein [Pseudomonas sp. KNUC1026]
MPAEDTLIQLLRPLALRNGFLPTAMAEVQVVVAQQTVSRSPQIYDPSLMVIAQGSKLAYLGERTLEYSAGHYLVQALPVPFEYETFATAERPLLGVAISVDLALLSELVQALGPDANGPNERQTPQSMASAPLDAPMREAVERLLRCLHHPDEREALGQARLREVIFAALRGPQGGALRALVEQRGPFARLAGPMNHLHRHFAQPLNVESLARQAHLSVSAFHAQFKRHAGVTPLQYWKRLRLIKAQQYLMAGEGVAQVALRVGYQSASQFSREYKRCFGHNPSTSSLEMP